MIRDSIELASLRWQLRVFRNRLAGLELLIQQAKRELDQADAIQLPPNRS